MFATAVLPLQSNPLHAGSLPAARDASDHLVVVAEIGGGGGYRRGPRGAVKTGSA